MALDAFRIRVPEAAREFSRVIRGWRENFAGARAGARGDRGFITPENFQEELIVLGLSGRKFGAEDYVSALSDFLGISISVHVIPDAGYPELARRLALSGRLGEIRYSDELGLAAIFVPESLPPLVFDLTVFHELGHLAAGDLLAVEGSGEAAALDRELSAGMFPTTSVRQGKRLARGLPFAVETAREQEANLRASYAFIAGCLGGENPYVHGMYEVL
ncbi:MAG: hypothetical protein WKF95_07485 [Rubrobacter sp.]